MKRNPHRLSSLASAVDCSVRAAISPSSIGTGRPRRVGSEDQISAASEPWRACTSSTAEAFATAASIFPRCRTMPASAISRSTSSGPYAATAAGSKPANAARKLSRLRRIVSHESPDWNPSRQSFS